MTLTLLGYLPKKRTTVPSSLIDSGVQEICSVSTCIAEAQPDWIDHWVHNDWGFCNSRQAALSLQTTPHADYDLYAFAIYSTRFRSGRAEPVKIDMPFGKRATEPPPPERLSPEPLSAEFTHLGFDAVSHSDSSYFECSPLSCNYMAKSIPVNRYCLVDSLSEAQQIACRFPIDQPEPGVYYVLQVFRAQRR